MSSRRRVVAIHYGHLCAPCLQLDPKAFDADAEGAKVFGSKGLLWNEGVLIGNDIEKEPLEDEGDAPAPDSDDEDEQDPDYVRGWR